MIEIRAATKRYEGRAVLGPLDLEVPKGKTTVLIGPSGCGKSTLLRLMVGLIAPDSGDVLFGGARLTRETLTATRRRIGYVIQEGGLFPHLSARGNASLLATHVGLPQQRIDERLASLAGLVRLSIDALDRFPSELSGGQRQRVSLMRALMLDPEVLLLDEPLGALDPLVRIELQEDLRRIFRELGKTVVLVTHDLAEAAFFGDVLVVLRDGGIVQKGSLDDLVRAPAHPFIEQFLRAHRHPVTNDLTRTGSSPGGTRGP